MPPTGALEANEKSGDDGADGKGTGEVPEIPAAVES